MRDRVREKTVARLAFGQRLVRLLLFGDVDTCGDQVSHFALRIANRIQRQIDVPARAIGVVVGQFLAHTRAAGCGLDQLAQPRVHFGNSLEPAGLLERPADLVLAAVSAEFQCDVVGVEHHAIRAQDAGEGQTLVVDAFEHALALAQAVLGAAAGADVLHRRNDLRRRVVALPEQRRSNVDPDFAAIAAQVALLQFADPDATGEEILDHLCRCDPIIGMRQVIDVQADQLGRRKAEDSRERRIDGEQAQFGVGRRDADGRGFEYGTQPRFAARQRAGDDLEAGPGLLHVVDVEIGPEPFFDAALRILQRHRAHGMPTVAAVMAAQAEFHIVGSADGDRVAPDRHDPFLVLRRDDR